MIEIPLTQSQAVLIDDEDFDLVSGYKWYSLWNIHVHSFYAVTNIIKPDGKRTSLYMHRLIMGAKKGQQVDHIHHRTLDNRKSELRLCTNSQNQHNRVKYANNSSGFKGVCFDKHRKKWKAQITLNCKYKFLGHYDTPELAYAAYCRAAAELHGEFARTV